MIQKAHPKVWFLSNLVGINLMPTIVVFIQFIGIQEFLQKNIAWNLWFLLGLIICLGAVYLEFTADRQMAIFKNRNCGQKKCIQEGLWKYSRHPNYFGEVSMWWGVWLMYFSGNQKIDFLILPPVLMTALFLFISIPMMEKKMVSSRPEYRRIQKQVSMLIPFFPRSEQNDEESAKTGE
jgi:steroid 5-alpha reductase family enzyme